MLDENRVVQLIRQEIQKSSAAGRYQLTPTNNHQHNGTDAPFAFQPVVSYIGVIATSSTIATMPVGWTLSHPGTGITLVTHNLGDLEQIAWVASPLGAGGASIPVPIIVPGKNVVQFSWFDVSTVGAGAPIDTSFFFAAIQVNNKTNSPTRYSVN